MQAEHSNLAVFNQTDLFSPVQVSSSGPNPTIYLSARLDLIRLPADHGPWFGWMEDWYHCLDADWFVWLRYRLNRAIKGRRLVSGFEEAENLVAQIAQIGIDHGIFTSVDIEPNEPRQDYDPWVDYPRHLTHEYLSLERKALYDQYKAKFSCL